MELHLESNHRLSIFEDLQERESVLRGQIEIMYCGIGLRPGTRAIGVKAPPNVRIDREEVHLRRMAERRLSSGRPRSLERAARILSRGKRG